MKQLNYQNKKQLQDQKCSNENMYYVFTTMENIYFIQQISVNNMKRFQN